jgi:hypothetical protein
LVALERAAEAEFTAPRTLNADDATRVMQLAAAADRELAEDFDHRVELATARDHPADWLRAGQALQRVLLTATSNGLAASFLYQPFELHDRCPPELGWWPWPECPQIVLRLGSRPGSPVIAAPRGRRS